MATAKRALRSLAVAMTIPFLLTLSMAILFGSGRRYRALPKPFWFPPLWAAHLAALACSLFMGLSAWLVWVEGGFHCQSDALPLYVAQVSLSLVWNPLVLEMGAASVGLAFCLVHFGTVVACYYKFRSVNPFAGVFVMPCLAWVAFLTFVNFKLAFI